MALALVVIATTQVIGYLSDPPAPLNDPAIRNLVTLFAMLIGGMAWWLWFCFGSNYSRPARFAGAALGLVGLIGLGGGIAALKHRRLLSFSGSLMPRLSLTERSDTSPPTAPVDQPQNAADLSSVTPDDYPQFLGPQRNGRIDTIVLARNWDSQPPRQVWKQSIGAGWSAFATRNGFAVTLEQRGPHETLTCYEVTTGKLIWSHAIEARHDTTLGGVGPRSTPTIHDGKIYTLGATGILQCVSGSGEPIWSEDLRARYQLTAKEDEEHVMFGRASSPLIVDDLVIVAGGGPQGKAKNLVAFDTRSGQLKWESECLLPDGTADQIAYASPTLATLAGRRQVLIVNESSASGHDPQSGECLWSHPWPGRSDGNASVSQCVPIDDSRVLLTKGYGGGAEMLELTGVEERLRVSSLWKVARVLQTKFTNVVVDEHFAYALSEGILECVDLDTGKRRWKNGRFGHGQILGVGKLLLVLSEDGELNLIELNSDKFTQVGKLQVLEGKTWNNLCLSGRHLLMRNAQEAACFELPTQSP